MDLNRHTGDRVALPGHKATALKESSEGLSLHLAHLFTGRSVMGPASEESVRAPPATREFSQLPVLETFFVFQGPPS